MFEDLLGGDQKPTVLFEIALAYYQPVFERLYSDDYPKRQKDLDQLKGLMEGYDNLQDFIDDTTLDPPEESGRSKHGSERLILSTIHSSKGLEFEAVCIIGLAEGRFPHTSAMFGEQWEEERRLLYVAATRAKKYLYLSYPRRLMTPDRQFRSTGMSPFLAELSGGLFERSSGDEFDTSLDFSTSSVAYSPPVAKKKRKRLEMRDFSVGCAVNHAYFGKGRVKTLSKGRSLDIVFDRHGLKTLHLDYAKLTIL